MNALFAAVLSHLLNECLYEVFPDDTMAFAGGLRNNS